MLRAEERDELDILRAEEHVNGRRAVASDAGVIRDEPDVLAAKRGETVGAQHVDSRQHRRRAHGAGSVPEGPKSRPVITAVEALGDRLVTAVAATVATRARSGVTSPFPSGCTRFDRKMTNMPVDGSIQIDVPVKPVCPNDPTGSSSPRFDENAESMSQPSPRVFGSRSGVAALVIFSTASGDRMRVLCNAPPPSSMRQKMARSAAVLNRPACPATPPMRRAVGSCTTPRNIAMSGP